MNNLNKNTVGAGVGLSVGDGVGLSVGAGVGESVGTGVGESCNYIISFIKIQNPF